MSLFFLIYILAAPTVAGSLVIAVLTMSDYTTNWLIAAGLAGFVIAAPVAWIIARNIRGSGKA